MNQINKIESNIISRTVRSNTLLSHELKIPCIQFFRYISVSNVIIYDKNEDHLNSLYNRLYILLCAV